MIKKSWKCSNSLKLKLFGTLMQCPMLISLKLALYGAVFCNNVHLMWRLCEFLGFVALKLDIKIPSISFGGGVFFFNLSYFYGEFDPRLRLLDSRFWNDNFWVCNLIDVFFITAFFCPFSSTNHILPVQYSSDSLLEEMSWTSRRCCFRVALVFTTI